MGKMMPIVRIRRQPLNCALVSLATIAASWLVPAEAHDIYATQPSISYPLCN
jgi:hypothetical protein